MAGEHPSERAQRFGRAGQKILSQEECPPQKMKAVGAATFSAASRAADVAEKATALVRNDAAEAKSQPPEIRLGGGSAHFEKSTMPKDKALKLTAEQQRVLEKASDCMSATSEWIASGIKGTRPKAEWVLVTGGPEAGKSFVIAAIDERADKPSSASVSPSTYEGKRWTRRKIRTGV